MRTGQAVKRLEEVALTCARVEGAVQRLEAKTEDQGHAFEVIETKCNQIMETLEALLSKVTSLSCDKSIQVSGTFICLANFKGGTSISCSETCSYDFRCRSW